MEMSYSCTTVMHLGAIAAAEQEKEWKYNSQLLRAQHNIGLGDMDQKPYLGMFRLNGDKQYISVFICKETHHLLSVTHSHGEETIFNE